MSRPITGCGRAIRARSSATISQGARATMGAALKCGVERVVYTSSVAALKPGPATRWTKPRATRRKA